MNYDPPLQMVVAGSGSEAAPGSQSGESGMSKDARTRKYYALDTDFTLSAPFVEWINKEEQRKGFYPDSSKPFEGLKFSEPPQIRFNRKRHRGAVMDANPIFGMWLVSDRLKALFERLDPAPEAFVFQRAEVDYSNFPEPGPGFWFCYFMRELDCVDEEASDLRYYDNVPGVKAYEALINVKMRPEVIGNARVFRLKYSRHKWLVDDLIVDAVKAEKIRGFAFKPVQKNH